MEILIAIYASDANDQLFVIHIFLYKLRPHKYTTIRLF